MAFTQKFSTLLLAALFAAAVVPMPALAQEGLDTGDTAWMLMSTVLVMLMIIPGLALFYGGLVRQENILAALMQTFATCAVVSITWIVVGYSLVFSEGNSFIGSLDNVMLRQLDIMALSGTIPETVFIMFQLTFAAITTALILGGVADRIKFSSMLIFAALWSVVVYTPIAHWVWGPDGYLGEDFMGYGHFIDFAGGGVVHIPSGVAGLVAAIVLGKRVTRADHEPGGVRLTVVGASLLWVGWFGFNAGSAVAAGVSAGMAMLVTQFATSAAALAWMITEWIARGKPTVSGTVTGAVAGLVGITPASGFVDPFGALIIGIASGSICYIACNMVKEKFGYDDSLDVFGVHFVGGLLGAILTGVFAVEAIGGYPGLLEGNSEQVIAQVLGSVIVIAYAAVASYIVLKVVQLFFGLRVTKQEEKVGLSLSMHDEKM